LNAREAVAADLHLLHGRGSITVKAEEDLGVVPL